jgi:AbrB family looped-hinge helix DNA binding protein
MCQAKRFRLATVSTRGRITLPAGIRRQDEIEPGQEFEIVRIEQGRYRLTQCQRRTNEGVVDRLLACPEKGFFVPIDTPPTRVQGGLVKKR